MTTSVLIVGAGIGGLTLAHALQQRGISFRVIEKARDLRAVGAGISRFWQLNLSEAGVAQQVA